MASDKKKKGVILLDRNKFDYYGDNLPNILRYNFSLEIARDLEIINKEQLNIQIKSFIETNKISPSIITIVLSRDICFEKDLTDPQKPEEGTEVQNFLDSIPFENTSVKLQKLEKGYKVIVANKDFYEAIKTAFEKLGFVVNSVVPGFILEKEIGSKKDLDPELSRYLINKSELIKKESLLGNIDNLSSNQKQNKNQAKKPVNIRLIILVGTFTFLIIVLIIVFIKSQDQNGTSSIKNKTLTSNTVKISPKLTSKIQPTNEKTSSLSADFKEKDVKIQVVGESNSSSKIVKLRQQLTEAGFINIKFENSTNTNSTKTVIIFNKNLSQNLREKITIEIKKISPETIIQENNDTEFDVTIVLEK